MDAIHVIHFNHVDLAVKQLVAYLQIYVDLLAGNCL